MTSTDDKQIYILDTNALIGFSLWLPIDLHKSFWSKLQESLESGAWVLLDVVVNEIKHDNDGLKKWCEEQRKKGLQKSIDDTHRNRAVEINNVYKMIDETSGKSTVDTYVIAYAEANKLVVFSRESPRVKATDLYKVPDVCKELKVKVIHKPKEFVEAIGFRN